MDCQIVKQGAPRKPQGSPNAGISGFALQKNVGATWELVIELLRCPLETHRKTPGSHMYSGQKVLSIIRHQNTQLLMKNLNILFKNFIFSSIWVLSLNQFQKLAKAIVVLFICMQRSKYFLVLELEIQLAKLLYYLYSYWNGFMLPLLQFSSSELSPQLLVPSHCKVMGISPQEHGKTSAFLSIIKKWIGLY